MNFMQWHRGTNARFSHTHWSVVLTAGGREAGESRNALERLCQSYRPPVYAFLRRRGYSSHDADDLAQSFFAALLAKPFLENVAPGNGTFRSFLLASLHHFLINEWERASAQKRGGGRAHVPLDTLEVESVPAGPTDMETLAYDRAWATTVTESAFSRLRAECEQAGKMELFQELQRHLLQGDEPPDAPEIAVRLEMTAEAVRQARLRLRRRFRELLGLVIAETVKDPVEVEQEARYLVSICARD